MFDMITSLGIDSFATPDTVHTAMHIDYGLFDFMEDGVVLFIPFEQDEFVNCFSFD